VPDPPGASAAAATATATAEVEHAPPEVQHAVDAAGSELDIAGVRAVWPAVVDTVKDQNLMLGAAIAKSRPCELRGDELVVAFGSEDSFYRRKAEDTACRQLVSEAVRSLTGRALRLVYDSRDDEPEPDAAPVLSEDEIIARFKAEFEAEEIVPDDEEPQR
jgi:DNA polymerase-3 subunit gamma/tau